MEFEPIPYFYDSINRNAIVVRPKKSFFNWANNIFKKDKPIWEKEENNIYLIQEMDSNESIREWIKENYDNLFVNELNDWYTNESGWPENRTYEMFCEWFDIEIHSMVLDLEDTPVTKE